jgi:carbohydrate diacid regulator
MVKLSYEVAQRIVGRLSSSLHHGISVTDAGAHVVASTDPSLVGTYDLLAARAMATGKLIEDGVAEVGSISLSLVYADEVVGAVILNDRSQYAKELVSVAKTLAELLIHQTNVIEQLPQEKWARDKFIADLLCGRLSDRPDIALQEAAILQIDLTLPRVVVVIDISQITAQVMERVPKNSSLPKIANTLHLEQLHQNLLEQVYRVMPPNEADVYAFVDDHWQVLLAEVHPRAADHDRKLLAQGIQGFLAGLAHTFGIKTSAGIGCYYPGWPALVHSYNEARCALEMGVGLHGPGHVFCIEELGLASFTWSDDRVIKFTLAQRLIQPLKDEPELLATLNAFLHANLSPSLAAQTLSIHRHTLAYRLDKIERLTGLDPRQFEAAAQLYAALVLWMLNGISC